MTNSRRLICICSQTKRTVSEYFNKACHQYKDQLLPIRGEIVKSNNRLLAQFYIDVQNGYIKAASYKCTTCVTLVVYCERLAEMVIGIPLREAIRIAPSDLIMAFPEVPFYKHDRASLVVQALQSAVRAATLDLPHDCQSPISII